MALKKYSTTDVVTGQKLQDRVEREGLPENAKWLLHENLITLKKRQHKKDPRRILVVDQEVDNLRYLGVSRKFIEKKHKITSRELDVLLYLRPFNYFTKKDINRISKSFFVGTVESLLERKIITCIYGKEELRRPNIKEEDLEDIYSLSTNSKRAVVYFYKLLTKEAVPYCFDNTEFSKDKHRNDSIKLLLNEMVENSQKK